MIKNKTRQTCKEYRIIPIADMPTVDVPPVVDQWTTKAMLLVMKPTTRLANKTELMAMGIHEFDRGANNVQALCVGYWCPIHNCGVDFKGVPWPGTKLEGKVGMYREARQKVIKSSLVGYSGDGGETRLMKTPFAVQSPVVDAVTGEVIPAVTLTEDERLARNLPRIMGDG